LFINLLVLEYLIASRIKNEIGWEAKTSLKEGLEKTIEWYKNNKQ
jgi:dTDP-D-glucose 4,6-dehydratase